MEMSLLLLEKVPAFLQDIATENWPGKVTHLISDFFLLKLQNFQADLNFNFCCTPSVGRLIVKQKLGISTRKVLVDMARTRVRLRTDGHTRRRIYVSRRGRRITKKRKTLI